MIIYKITNKVNGKAYVGLSHHKDIDNRKKTHKRDWCSIKRKGFTTNKLYNAFEKYGWANFQWDVIDTAKTESELNEKEIYWIDKLNLIKNGYNINKGGTGGDNFKNHPNMDTVRRKISRGVLEAHEKDHDLKKRIGETVKIRMNDPEYKERWLKQTAHVWENNRELSNRKKMSEKMNVVLNSEENKKKISDGVREAYEKDPILRERLSQSIKNRKKKLVKKEYFPYKGKVYDLKMKDGDPSYVVSGITVHNSAAGSLIAYLLDITRIDPLEHDLLFERFLNEGRIKTGLPDIDLDLPGSQRDKVKHYLESKYGRDNVCSVGTYGTLQLKAAIQILSRSFNIPAQEYRKVSAIIDTDSDGGMKDLVNNALKKPSVAKFINDYPMMFHILPLLLKQPRSNSIHASATIIVPSGLSIQEMIPAKEMMLGDGSKMLISEWEGGELDTAGYLKEDLLGIRQLDKLQDIVATTGVDIYSIPLNDPDTMAYFQMGHNSDVFHYGSKGLTKYSKLLQPQNFKDLSAGIALYRPGTMESGFHEEYILRKDNMKPIIYFEGLEEITKDTYGLIVYQEQIMQICTEIASFDLNEADDIRRALGKKKQKVIDAYAVKFLERSMKNGFSEKGMKQLWEIMAKFAKYSFNKAHSASYASTAYITQWFKVHHPIAFWSTAFKFVFSDTKKDEKIPSFINELNQTSDIHVEHVQINKSGLEIVIDEADKTIYWPLSSVQGLGEKALTQIMNDREENGPYLNFNDFLERVMFKGSKVNKTGVINLIHSGAFDKIQSFKSGMDRVLLLNEYYSERGMEVDYNYVEDWQLWLAQKKACKFVNINWELFIEMNTEKSSYNISTVNDCLDARSGEAVEVAGFVSEVIRKTTKKGSHANIVIEANSAVIDLKFWYDSYEKWEEELKGLEGKIIIATGIVRFDKYQGENTVVVAHDNRIKTFSHG